MGHSPLQAKLESPREGTPEECPVLGLRASWLYQPPSSDPAPGGCRRQGVWDEIREKGRELLVPALLPAFRGVTEGHIGTGNDRPQWEAGTGQPGVGVRAMPPAGGGGQGGDWEGSQAYPCGRGRGSTCVNPQEG